VFSKISDDPKIKREVGYFTTYELENFKFPLGMTIWYDILFVVNLVIKNLRSKDMCIIGTTGSRRGLNGT